MEFLFLRIRLIYFFSILSKIISVSEQTINYRKDLRRIYRFYTNQQQTLKFIQDGRIKFDFQK